MGIEIFQHLAPQMVDGTVAFVGDNDVEGLDRDAWVVLDRFDFFEWARGAFERPQVVLGANSAICRLKS